jgi:hypothetical protein
MRVGGRVIFAGGTAEGQVDGVGVLPQDLVLACRGNSDVGEADDVDVQGTFSVLPQFRVECISELIHAVVDLCQYDATDPEEVGKVR